MCQGALVMLIEKGLTKDFYVRVFEVPQDGSVGLAVFFAVLRGLAASWQGRCNRCKRR